MNCNFGTILRRSRLGSLAPNLPRPTNSDSSAFWATPVSHPLAPVLQATPSSLHRRDWGLKSPLPSKQKSPYIQLRAMNSMENWVAYDGGEEALRKLQKLREFGVPLSIGGGTNISYIGTSKRSLIEDSKVALAALQRARAAKLIRNATVNRQENRARIYKSHRRISEVFGSKMATQQALADVLNVAVGQPMDNSSYSFAGRYHDSPDRSSKGMTSTHKPSLGVLYKMAGTLSNLPDAIYEAKRIPGRMVEGRGVQLAAVGGFIAHVTAGGQEEVDRQSRTKTMRVLSFIPRAIRVHKKTLNISVASADIFKKSPSFSPTASV